MIFLEKHIRLPALTAVLLALAGLGLAPRAAEAIELPARADLRARLGMPLARGEASYYGPGFHGRPTASGERFDRRGLTAAHRSLPFGSRLLVENLKTGQKVVVRVNDRGPYARGRLIDLSEAAGRMIGLGPRGPGTAAVRITRLPALR